MKRWCVAGALAWSAFAVSNVWCDTLSVSADGQVNLVARVRGGSLPSMFVRNQTPGAAYRGYARFDLSPLPPGASIAKATLRLWVAAVVAEGVVDVVPVLTPWDEATLSGPGGPRVDAAVASFPVARASVRNYVTVDVTGLVQSWLDGSLANDGLALQGAEADPVSVRFDTKESVASGHGPELEVALTSLGPEGPQGPAGADGVQGPPGPAGPPGAVPAGAFVMAAPGDPTLLGAGFGDTGGIAGSAWIPTSTTGAPAGRVGPSAVWTGSRMLVWGGSFLASGAGLDGGQYDPLADTWTSTSTVGAPAARLYQTAVWTGSKMIVWGGASSGDLNTGGVYDPALDTWKSVATTGAPVARAFHTAVWTGSRMIVWGGFNGTTPFADGASYDPVADAWSPIASAGAPTARGEHVVVWTGSKMIVWGGFDGTSLLSTGGIFDPASNTWAPLAAAGAPAPRIEPQAVWTGSRMIVWGGSASNTGGVYDPSSNTWTATTTTGAPDGRRSFVAVWTGSRMLVWGGYDATQYVTSGGLYDPVANSWTATPIAGEPQPRQSFVGVWTGSRFVVWGGSPGGTPFVGVPTGGQLFDLHLYRKG